MIAEGIGRLVVAALIFVGVVGLLFGLFVAAIVFSSYCT